MALVLLVEDNENDEVLAVRALRNLTIPCEMHVARDGVQALDYLLDQHLRLPDFVLLDLKLPRMSGMEVIKQIRAAERTRRLPVIVLTSSDEPLDVSGCFDSGANSFVRKPVGFEEYLARVRKLVEYWLTVNEPCASEAPAQLYSSLK